ncbi:MAG: endonuclease III [Deltaproteobacteria bacterium]|nr:MAG: endonuclease III [Deltaproteobacteria bacterium]
MRDRLAEIHRRLKERYGPVRNPHGSLGPMDNLVLTILSQNTNDVLRDRAFKNLKKLVSRWEEVLRLPDGRLEEAIRPAGLAEQKAGTIRRAVARVVSERGEADLSFLRGMDPEDAYRYLREIKGVGDKTASIVLLFSFGFPFFPVDTHIQRVTKRLGIAPPSHTPEKIRRDVEPHLKRGMHVPLHVNIIRLGRELCKPKNPLCSECPLKDLCDFGGGKK